MGTAKRFHNVMQREKGFLGDTSSGPLAFFGWVWF